MPDKTHLFKKKALPFTALLVVGFSIFLPLCSQAAIVAGAASTGSMNNTNTANVSYTVAAGNNRLLIVGISTQQPTNTVTSVSYGGTALTKISHVAHASQTRVEFWYLLSPAVGTNTLTVNTSSSTNTVFGIQQFTGVDQDTPFGTFVSATGTSTTATVNASSASGELVFGTVGWNNGNLNTIGASQTEYWDLSMNSSISGAGSAEAGAATVTISWTNSGAQPWSIAAVPIKPAVSGMPGGVLTPSFWVMGNNGTSTTTNNTTLSTWSDQSGSGNNATAGTAPTFKDNATDNFNFNPVVTFNGTSQFLNIGSNLGLTTTNVGTVFSVVRMASGAAGNDCILGSQTNTTGAAQVYVANASAPYALVMHRLGGTSPTGLVTSNSQITATTPTILSTRRNSADVDFWFNGTDQTSGTPNMTAAWASANRRLGATQAASTQWYLAANMAETVVYGSSLANYQVQNIESYLAVKYGITLSHNYYASDWNGTTGTTFWNTTTNSGFNNNIAGIGRDDAGGSANATLLQKQSRSINTSTSGDLVVMGLNAIATNNASNIGSFSADRTFLMWGDNNGSIASWTTTESPSVIRQRLTREWRVQETGTVGNVVVRVQDNSAISGAELPAEVLSAVYILVDADGDFSSGATEYPMTLSSTNWEATVDFTTGQYFTFATRVLPTPGGVTAPAIWLKANTGVTTGATFTWADQSGNSRNGTQSTAGNQPTLTTTSINYNPAVTFDGTNDYLTVSNLTGLPTGASQVEEFAVANHLNTSSSWAHIFSYGTAPNTGQTFGLVKQQTTANAATALYNVDAISSAQEFTGGVPVLLDGKYNGTAAIISTFGVQRASTTSTANKTTAVGYIGVDPGLASTTHWNGNIPEIILFGTNLSTTDVQKVNSYLALKYGITIDQTTATSYLASDGSTIWNGSTNSSNKNNIAGIGRDDLSDLNQKQSKSVNIASSGDLVAMGLGTIATNNAANSNTFLADKSFLIWGDNAGANTWQNTEAPSTTRWRLTREWKVQETGTVGTVQVRVQDNSATSGGELPSENTTVYLLVDADGDFTSGATEYAMTLNGSNWETTVDFSTGQYFTFATVAGTAPGGVVADLSLWLKANAGTSTTTDGSNVTSWADQSLSGNNATTTANSGTNWTSPGSNPPVYKSGSSTNGLNFNPTVNFSGSKSLDGAGGLGTHQVFTVFNNVSAGGTMIIGYDDPNGNGGGGESGLWFDPSYLIHATRNTSAGNNQQIYSSSGLGTPSTTAILDMQQTSSSAGNFYINGVSATGAVSPNGTPPSPFSGKYRLGKASNNSFASSPVFAEVISYGRSLSTSERQRVTSYLAAKYGLTLTVNYYGSDWDGSTGTIFWNQTTNAGYNNNIAVIGRDDVQGFNQKQSRSINTSSNGNMVTVGLGSIATENSTNSNVFPATESFLAWGDNNGSTAKTTTNTPTGTCARMTRIWKVQETGTEVGNVAVRLDLSSLSATYGSYTATQLRLAVASNATFSSGVRTYTASSYTSGVATFSGVDLDNGEFFTLGVLEGNFNPAISSNSPVCEGGELNLFASGGTSYTWSGPFGFSSNLQNPEIGYATFSHDGTYSVTISNSFNCSAVLTVVVEVNSCNPNTCQYDVCNNTTVSGSITGTDADGDALTYTTFQSPAHGTLSIVGNNFTYDPADNYVGEDQFTIRTCDPSGACVDCVKKFVVTECGAVPVCGTNSTLTTCMGVAGSGTLNATDPSGGGITYAIVSQPSGGTVSLVGANYTFTPNSGFEGATTWVYSATNANGSIECTVTAFAENCFSTCDGGGCGSTNLITGGTYYTSGSNVFCQSGISVSTNTEYCFKANLTDNCSACDSTAKVFFTINSIQIGQIYNADLPSATASTQGFSFNTADIGNPTTISVCITHVNFGTPGTHIVAASPELRSVGNILPTANDDSGISICKNSGAYTTAVLDNDVNVLSTATLSITSSMPGATGTVSISGKNVVFTPSSTFVGTTTITYQICNGTCCDAADLSVEVVEPTISLPTTPICGATSVVLSATVGGISSSLANFQWQSSSNNLTWTNISNATATSYSVSTLSSTTYFRIVMTPLSANCSVLASSSEVVSPNFPSAAAGSNTPICVGGTAQFTGSASGGQSPYTWAWSGAASFSSTAQNPTRSNATLAMAGNYTLTVTDAFGCTGSQTTVLVVNSDPSATVNVPTNTVCVGGNVTLTATASGGSGTCGFQWQSSPNGTTWTDISGATNSSFTTPNLSSQTRYRVIYACSGEGCCN